MMGDHSNEETEYPTNSSSVDDPDDTLVHTLPPSPTAETADVWQACLMVFLLLSVLGGAFLALKYYERRWLFEYEHSSHAFGKREKAGRKEQLEKELKVKIWSSCDLEGGETSHTIIEYDYDSSSSMEIDTRTVEKVVVIEDDSNSVDEDDQPECAICLEHFRDSQLVCEPTNEKCNHSFHKDCMTVWLMLHTRCPICREKYLEENNLEVEPNV